MDTPTCHCLSAICLEVRLLDQAHDNSRTAGGGGLAYFTNRVLVVTVVVVIALAAWWLAVLVFPASFAQAPPRRAGILPAPEESGTC